MESLQSLLESYLADRPHQHALAVGALACRLVRQSPQLQDSTTWQKIARFSDLTELEPDLRYDAAIVSDIFEQLPHESVRALIARLRDVQTAALMLVVNAEHAERYWSEQEFLSLGLANRGLYRFQDKTYRVYTFDINSYKQTPDWLNPNNWAHPERWEKHRW